MQESMPNPAQPTARLFANGSSPGRPIARRVPHICPNLADVGRAEGPSRFSRTAFPPAVAHRSRKYFRIKCVDDFHFRSKYIPAARSRGTPYAFENTIESRKLLQNQMHGPRSKKRGPMESNTCTPSGVGGGRGVGGPPNSTFVRVARRSGKVPPNYLAPSTSYLVPSIWWIRTLSCHWLCRLATGYAQSSTIGYGQLPPDRITLLTSCSRSVKP
jgi:hypothetical protein